MHQADEFVATRSILKYQDEAAPVYALILRIKTGKMELNELCIRVNRG